MFNFLPVYKREVKTYFQSPSTYVVLALFFLIVGIIFFLSMRQFSMYSERAGMGMFGQMQEAPNVTTSVIEGIFSVMTSLIMFTIPMLAMRLVAEERSRGTFELLVTCPIGDWAILLGKYFALLTIGLVVVLLSAIFPIIVWYVGKANNVSPEWPVVISCWIGIFLIFATYSAFGLMASAFTENQVIAAVITLIGIILWYLIGAFQIENPKIQEIMLELAAARHMENFNKGVLMLKDFAFYILSAFLFLFVASKTLDARRWRV